MYDYQLSATIIFFLLTELLTTASIAKELNTNIVKLYHFIFSVYERITKSVRKNKNYFASHYLVHLARIGKLSNRLVQDFLLFCELVA